jgi:hypothetical protein
MYYPPYIPTCGTDLLTDGCSDSVQGMPSAVAAIPSYPSSFTGKLLYHFKILLLQTVKVRRQIGCRNYYLIP